MPLGFTGSRGVDVVARSQVEELEQYSKEITQVVDLIVEISEQTKNLALNADY